jgi:ligand-binding sensor domain-containing protein
VVRFDGLTWKVWNKTDIGVGNDWFSAIAADSKGNIWAGTYLSGGEVAKFDGQNWTEYKSADSGITADFSLLSIVCDSPGNAWFGGFTQANGPGQVARFDGKIWTVYSTADSTLPAWLGWGLTVGKQGVIWAGGGSILAVANTTNGVGKFDGQTWTVYTPSNSKMPSKKAYSLAQDSYGNMWMGTEIGLVAYRPGGVLLPGVLTLT